MSTVQDDYFTNIVSNLSSDDFEILGILFEMNATSSFKSVGNQTVFKQSKLTESKYRNAINRLIALDFISHARKLSKENFLFISPYGCAAFELFLFKESEVV